MDSRPQDSVADQLGDSLRSLAPRERATVKATTLANVSRALWASDTVYGPSGTMRWEQDGVAFTVTQEPSYADTVMDGSGRAKRIETGLLRVVVTAEKAGKPLPLVGANPFLFVNPPLKVPTGRKVTDATGAEVDEFIEDHEAAFRTVVADAVLTAARKRGWR